MSADVDLGPIVAKLVRWGRSNGRNLAWRRTKDPFELLVAEVLLQKTKASDAEAVWTRVLRRFPTPSSLAGARDSDLRPIVEPLGLGQQRVRRLCAMAICVASHGYAAEQKIDGIGPYGAAVLSLTLGREAETLPVDGNVARIVCRYFGLTFERGEPRKKREVHDLVESLLATQDGSQDKLELTYALVDLGNAVCTPRKPGCHACPLADGCAFPPPA